MFSIIAREFQAHSTTFESLSMGSRSRAIPEPWSPSPVHTALEMEASLLDSEVQEILGKGKYELASGLQLQWATQADFPDFVRLSELDCCANSSYGGWR